MLGQVFALELLRDVLPEGIRAVVGQAIEMDGVTWPAEAKTVRSSWEEVALWTWARMRISWCLRSPICLNVALEPLRQVGYQAVNVCSFLVSRHESRGNECEKWEMVCIVTDTLRTSYMINTLHSGIPGRLTIVPS